MIKRALISVSDKTGIVEFAKGLAALKIEILSTGGTAKLLRENKIPVVEVGDYTGQPEILDGRLKTLHPKIHGGVLAIRSNPRHLKELKESGIEPIDLLAVNLYPFEETIAKANVALEEAIEQIDIGGPTMIRAAAKNWRDVTVVVDPGDYQPLLEELRRGGVSPETNFRLAKKVFILTARYDGAIANYLTGMKDQKWPEVFNHQVVKAQDLRYGENPHQKAAFYRDRAVSEPCVSGARQLHGKELSFNNILDLDAAIETVKEFTEAACVIIKHTNPCGVAAGAPPHPSLLEEMSRPSPARGEGAVPLRDIFIAARECDPLSAFGGIIGFNRPVDTETAAEIGKDFYECVVAPRFDPEALKILEAKKNIRLMELQGLDVGARLVAPLQGYDMKKVVGGLLIQERDLNRENIRESKMVTKRKPTEEEWQALAFAWLVCKHVKSNAIVLARGGGSILRTLGIGCGQMSRIDSTRIAISKSRQPLKGAVMASDAFFPFRDNIDHAAKGGIAAIIQPGGSLRDEESIKAADLHGIAMVFTGIRHFRH
jgi:phosphoribosylaminoimidazolecarboxamide formyltransferase/IMP cyclohydrolase